MTDKPDPRADKELAQGLVDTLRAPDPKRAAERATFEAEKEREDKAALEAFYRATGQVPANDDPARWIAEIDRLLPLVQPEPPPLASGEWKASREANERLIACLNELLKFIPAGHSEIPAHVLTADGQRDRVSRPERYQRAWIEAQRDHCLGFRARANSSAE
jgi:hypothetical protein